MRDYDDKDVHDPLYNGGYFGQGPIAVNAPTVYVDACGTGIGVVIGEQNYYLPVFIDISTNQGEYLAIIYGAFICGASGITNTVMCSDSELAVNQIKGKYRSKNPGLKHLTSMAKSMLETLGIELKHIRGLHNPADIISRGGFKEEVLNG